MNAKNVCALIILPVALIPFESSAEEARVDGKGNAADVVVTTVGGASANWNTLVSVEILIPANQIWHCVATASAEALNPGGLDNRYRFTLTRNDTSPVVGAGCERTIDVDDNAGVDDATNYVVGTTCPFLNVFAGTHTIRLLATKVTAGDANMIVDDSSLTVVCTNNQL